jgi:tetratricopeptide (TPR) repeat protein
MTALLVAALCLAMPDSSAPAEFEGAQNAAAANRLGKAISLYRAAVAKAPSFAPAVNGLGRALFLSGQRTEALEEFKKSIAVDPSFAVAYLNLGFAMRATGDLEGALAAYERYAQIAPWDPAGFSGLSDTHQLMGDAKGAELALAKCRKLQAGGLAEPPRDRGLFALEAPSTRTVVATGQP